MLYTEIPTRALKLTYRPTDCNTMCKHETHFYFALSGKSRQDAVCPKGDESDGHVERPHVTNGALGLWRLKLPKLRPVLVGNVNETSTASRVCALSANICFRCFSGTLTQLSTFGTTTQNTNITTDRHRHRAQQTRTGGPRVPLTRFSSSRRRTRRN